MFRSVKVLNAPLAALKPVLSDSISSHNSVRRILGSRSFRRPNINAANSIIEKTKGHGLAGTAAVVARAASFLQAKNPSATIEEIDAVLPNISDEALRHLAIGIRLRAHNDLLDVKEAALTVSGGASESEVADIRAKVKEDYMTLVENSPGCWLVELAAAEYRMYTGEADEAHKQFVAIEKMIKDFIQAPVIVRKEVASPENMNQFLCLGFPIYRTRYGVKPAKVNAIVAEGMANTMSDPNAKAALEEVKKVIGTQVTDEEAVEIALTLYEANVRHHFHDYFPVMGEHYDGWTSAEAQKTSELINSLLYPQVSSVPPETFDKVRNSTPNKAFYDSEDKLRALLKSMPKDKSAIASIREAFGPGPNTALCSADQVVYTALESIGAAGPSVDMAGSTEYVLREKNAAKELAKQMLYRTQVQKGVALIELNRMHEAVESITPVINANEYIYMWRAFLARSRAYKGLGLITKSDKDLKALNALKRSITERTPYEKK